MEIVRYRLGEYFKLPNSGLINYFNRVHDGQEEDYRTPFFNEAPRDKILNQWLEELNSLCRSNLVPGLFEFEEDMASKVGPLSVMKPLSERMEDIKHYYDLVRVKSEPIHPEAIKRFLSKIDCVRVAPYSFEETVNQMRLSTNSGAPYFHKRRTVVDATRSILDFNFPAILGWRGQEGGPDVEDVKQRVVWMFPFSVNIKELSVYTPLIKAWQAHNINSAYISMRAVEEKLTKLFDTKGDNYIVVTDFSKFDQHFNKQLQFAARDCITQMVPAGGDWLRAVFPIKYNIPLAISPFEMCIGEHGMGSGSGGTNFDECCAHSCLQEEAALLDGKVLNPYSNAYGDDGYLSYDGIDVDNIIKRYTSHGQEMNVDKQFVSKNSAIYLRRYFHTSWRDRSGIMLGIYATTRALGRILGQERFWNHDEVGYAEYLTLRAWSILENCNNHPYFDEFVKFVIKGDQYKLGLSIPGFMDKFENIFDELRDLDPDVLGYTKTLQTGQTSVKDWRIYKLLRSM